MSKNEGFLARGKPFAGIIFAVFGLAGAFSFYFWANPTSPYRGLIISEVMTSNGETLSDEDGDYRDWIELENRGTSDIDLSGVALQREGARSWEIPALTLEPSETILIWASSKDRNDAQSELHTSFRLSRDGVQLDLRAEDGKLIHSINVPALARDSSFGVHPSFSDVLCFFPDPTPGVPNSNMCIEEALTR